MKDLVNKLELSLIDVLMQHKSYTFKNNRYNLIQSPSVKEFTIFLLCLYICFILFLHFIHIILTKSNL